MNIEDELLAAAKAANEGSDGLHRRAAAEIRQLRAELQRARVSGQLNLAVSTTAGEQGPPG